MEEFRIGLDRSVGLLIPCPTHNLTVGGWGGGCQGQVPLHSLSNIKSEDIEIQLSRRVFMGQVLCVRLRVMSLLRESQLKGVKKGRDHFEGSFY